MATPEAERVTVAEVREIARNAHAGQVDKQHRDYFLHHVEPIAYSLGHLGDNAVMAGYLHDVLEDCEGFSAETLRGLGVPDEVVRAVVSVTRRHDETYWDLITRSCADPLGVHVKLADNAHNILSSPGLAATDADAATHMLARRYLPARDRLIAARTRMEERSFRAAGSEEA